MISPAMHRFSSVARRLALTPKRLQSTQTSVQTSAPETRITTLPNGFRVASEHMDLPTCTVGLWVKAGSRNESPQTNGTSNFLEHMAFKGTSNRSQQALEAEVQKMGARLDATASREHTVYNAKAFSNDLPNAVEILADVVQNTSLGEEEIEREREVILQEMDEAEKNYQEVIMDYLHATGFQQTPLAQSPLGTIENIRKLRQDDLQTFKKAYYRPCNMVLAAAGGVDHNKLVDLAKQYFGSSDAPQDTDYGNLPPCQFTGSEIRHRNDNMPFVHVGLAVEGVGMDHHDAIPLLIGSHIIGSWDRTSTNGEHFPNPLVRRMAREGLCAGFQAFNTIHSDTGLWGIYYISDNANVYDCTIRVQDEIMRVCLQTTDFEIQRAKNTLLTNLGSYLDGTTPVCDTIGKQVLHLGYRMPWEELVAQIHDVSPQVVKGVVEKYVYDQCPAVAALGPTEAIPMYNHIRAKMYKINSGIF